MDALKLLKQQHRLVEKLFEKYESSDEEAMQAEIFNEIADHLAVHATIEERHFYPAVRARQTEENVAESYEEHLEIKRLLLDAMGGMKSLAFDDKVAALKGAVDHHVGEEENELFPKVQKLIDKEVLEVIGGQMEEETRQLMEAGDPRNNVRPETEPPAVQP